MMMKFIALLVPKRVIGQFQLLVPKRVKVSLFNKFLSNHFPTERGES